MRREYPLKKLLAAVAAPVVAAGTALVIAPSANAFPLPGPGYCAYPGTGGGAMVFGAGGYWCDYPVEETGQHYHCEWGGFIGYGGSCTWRWGDNTIAPPPPPELIGW